MSKNLRKYQKNYQKHLMKIRSIATVQAQRDTLKNLWVRAVFWHFLTLFFFQKMIMKRLWKKSLSHPCQSSSFLASPNFSTILMKIPIPCGKVFWHVAVLKLLPIWSWMLVSGVSKQIMISFKHLCEYKIVLKNNAHFCCWNYTIF